MPFLRKQETLRDEVQISIILKYCLHLRQAEFAFWESIQTGTGTSVEGDGESVEILPGGTLRTVKAQIVAEDEVLGKSKSSPVFCRI